MLQCAYLEESRPPRILLWGDQTDMRAFSENLRKVPSNSTKVSLGELSCRPLKGLVILVQFCKAGALGMKKVTGEEGTFLWSLDQNYIDLFAEMIETLSSSPQGHQYLDCGTWDDVTVCVSCGEYPQDFVVE